MNGDFIVFAERMSISCLYEYGPLLKARPRPGGQFSIQVLVRM